jgi:hypothetical protein
VRGWHRYPVEYVTYVRYSNETQPRHHPKFPDSFVAFSPTSRFFSSDSVIPAQALSPDRFLQAKAAPITYFESITTDGVLGGTAFTNELVTLTFTADTSNVTFFQGSNFTRYTNIPSVSTVTVAGVGSATFSDPI